MISVSKKGNYGYFCCVQDSLEDLFLLCIATCWEDSNGWLMVYFLSGWTCDIKGGILNIYCWFIHKRRSNESSVDMWKGFQAWSYTNPFCGKRLCKIESILTLRESLLEYTLLRPLLPPPGQRYMDNPMQIKIN